MKDDLFQCMRFSMKHTQMLCNFSDEIIRIWLNYKCEKVKLFGHSINTSKQIIILLEPPNTEFCRHVHGMNYGSTN